MKLIPAAFATACFAHSFAAHASDALIGQFALEQKWESGAKGVCRVVDAALAQRLASPKFHCPAKPSSGTASGRRAVTCNGDRVEILVFRSRADCESEIRASGANND